MADKDFGIKRFNLISSSGTPKITSPTTLNLNAPTVAISTDATIGGKIQSDVIVGTGYSVGIGSTQPQGVLDVNGGANISGVVTATSFTGSGSNLTGIVTGIEAGDNITILESPAGNFIVTSTYTETQTLDDVLGLGNTSDTGLSVGVVTATSFTGDGSNLVDGKWTLGANGSNDYTFTGIGFTQTTNDPVLYLARGNVYEFVNNSGGSHPFQIRVSNGGAAYSDGVTNNGSATGTIKFEVPFNAPNTLYYQCTNHSSMGNTINVYPTTA
tara:strand:+ start:457 stop:1266 length:810 start_codon:yes stop_codon:yes gene_type:complete